MNEKYIQPDLKAIPTYFTRWLICMISYVHPSIHPSSSAYPGPGRRGSSLSRDGQTSFSLDTSSYSSGRNTEAFPGQSGDIILPVGRAQNTSPGRRPGGIQNRCPSHLSWLLSMSRSSGSTLSSSRVNELLTLSLRERPATLRRKLISAACIRDLVLSVMTHSSWP